MSLIIDDERRAAYLEVKERDNCNFCTPNPDQFSHFSQRGLDRIDLVTIRDTDHFTVKPDSLPAHPQGFHMLLIPREHRYGYASLPPEYGDEVAAVMTELETTLGEPLAFFEHGGVKHGGKVQSVYHAHAHLIGTGGNDVISYMARRLRSEGIDFESFTSSSDPVDTIRSRFQGSGYLFVQDGHRAIMAHDPGDVFPSQLAQRSMSALLTGEIVDWKKIPHNPHFARLSVERISSLLERVGVAA